MKLRAADGYTFVELLVVIDDPADPRVGGDAAGAGDVAAAARGRTARGSCATCARRSTSSRTPPTQGQIASFELKAGNEGYPPDLETLVEGVTAAGDATGRKLKFLRRIPIDPMTNCTEWGLRAYSGQAGLDGVGRQHVFDVYTKSKARHSTARNTGTGRCARPPDAASRSSSC